MVQTLPARTGKVPQCWVPTGLHWSGLAPVRMVLNHVEPVVMALEPVVMALVPVRMALVPAGPVVTRLVSTCLQRTPSHLLP